MLPTYKLVYFDARGKAELSRLCFAAAGVKFEDERVTREEWPALKPAMPFGQLPVLDINGKLFGQSSAIEKYLAREFALYGKTSLEALEIDEIIGLGRDYADLVIAWYKESDETKKAQLGTKLLQENLPKFLKALESKLTNNVRGYLVGNQMTLADLAIYDMLENNFRKTPELLQNYPKVIGHRNRIASSQKISTYLKNRKETEF
ncbi:probable glutathione S-transferase 6 [Patella vulgata]|uniref:probable glutathione S-transferase 6 n=1 Tax=Patella vulgata TaxID=6465 RepID=UPI00217FD9BE|nr:probable glutathione S-transferase 6 [Patella vulgata]